MFASMSTSPMAWVFLFFQQAAAFEGPAEGSLDASGVRDGGGSGAMLEPESTGSAEPDAPDGAVNEIDKYVLEPLVV